MSSTLGSIPTHAFSGAIFLATTGEPPDRSGIINQWSLIGDEVVQLDAIIAVYQGKSTEALKDRYIGRLISSLLVYEDNTISKTQTESILEI